MSERTVMAGDRIKDNDPRMPGRVLTVVRAGGESVFAQDTRGQQFEIAIRRIYTDGKPRRGGFSLIEDDGTPQPQEQQ